MIRPYENVLTCRGESSFARAPFTFAGTCKPEKPTTPPNTAIS
jgi:hypothetical protein